MHITFHITSYLNRKLRIFTLLANMPFSKDYILIMVWYGILGFNVPLDTVWVISEAAGLSSDMHLPFSNGGPAT